jgi:hypothetical protein
MKAKIKAWLTENADLVVLALIGVLFVVVLSLILYLVNENRTKDAIIANVVTRLTAAENTLKEHESRLNELKHNQDVLALSWDKSLSQVQGDVIKLHMQVAVAVKAQRRDSRKIKLLLDYTGLSEEGVK